MDAAKFAELSSWLTEAGLAGNSETEIVDGFCGRAVTAGLPIARAMVIIDTLHPVHEGRVVRWRREGQERQAELIEYGPTNEGEAAESWQRSAFFRLREEGGSRLRRRLVAGEPAEFPAVVTLQNEGMTDYLALITRFAADGVIGEMDCVYSSWATDHPRGFDDREVEALIGLMPLLALAVKCVSLTRIAGTLVETYLGRDAGRRVLAGRIRRGIAEPIGAVLWYSDLRGFTRITDQAPPQQVIPLLNDYAEAVISAVHDSGGDVLKLIGDGTLAIFTSGSTDEACRCAIEAETTLRRRVDELNRRRAGESLPTTDVYLGLHVGEVFYGNIGSKDRLDFTVVGPAVNEVSRIAAMCRSAERNVLLSAAFAEAVAEPERSRLVSVGRYALRGVERPQELFTLTPAA
ncbi:MAG: adenylate/guanylate cyclase domain-containing protein [Alphaproteobacteria bacterium]|nr:MAG: adenylate/guanylate cyclase domain-containing protein [Alphaproteobacteria bacterium]